MCPRRLLCALIVSLGVSCAANDVAADDGLFVLRHAGRTVIRFNRETGSTHVISGREWLAIAEPAPIPKSSYEVIVTAYQEFTDTLRIDTSTGQVWVVFFDKTDTNRAMPRWFPIQDKSPDAPIEGRPKKSE